MPSSTITDPTMESDSNEKASAARDFRSRIQTIPYMIASSSDPDAITDQMIVT